MGNSNVVSIPRELESRGYAPGTSVLIEELESGELRIMPAEQAADQLRDRAGLESALGRPRNYLLYEQADLALQAAALAHGIAESQTFIDGNKRLALVAMLTFLEINGLAVDAPDPELAKWILSLNAGSTPGDLADLIRSRLRAVG